MKIVFYSAIRIDHAMRVAQAFEDIGATVINIASPTKAFGDFVVWARLENMEMMDKFYKELGIGKKGRK